MSCQRRVKGLDDVVIGRAWVAARLSVASLG